MKRNFPIFIFNLIIAALFTGCFARDDNQPVINGNTLLNNNDTTSDINFIDDDETFFKIIDTGSFNAFQSITLYKDGFVLAGVGENSNSKYISILITDAEFNPINQASFSGLDFITDDWSGYRDLRLTVFRDKIFITGAYNTGDTSYSHRGFYALLDKELNVVYSKTLDTAFTVDIITAFFRDNSVYLIHDASYNQEYKGFIVSKLAQDGSIQSSNNIDPDQRLFLADIFVFNDQIFVSAADGGNYSDSFLYRLNRDLNIVYKLKSSELGVVRSVLKNAGGITVSTDRSAVFSIKSSGEFNQCYAGPVELTAMDNMFGLLQRGNDINYFVINYIEDNQKTLFENGLIDINQNQRSKEYFYSLYLLSVSQAITSGGRVFLIGNRGFPEKKWNWFNKSPEISRVSFITEIMPIEKAGQILPVESQPITLDKMEFASPLSIDIVTADLTLDMVEVVHTIR